MKKPAPPFPSGTHTDRRQQMSTYPGPGIRSGEENNAYFADCLCTLRGGGILEAGPLVFRLPARLLPTGKARVGKCSPHLMCAALTKCIETCLVIPAKRTRLPPMAPGLCQLEPVTADNTPFRFTRRAEVHFPTSQTRTSCGPYSLAL